MNPPIEADKELRDKLTAIKHQRDYHLMDEPEYIDELIKVFEAYRDKAVVAELESLPITHPKIGIPGVSEGYIISRLAELKAIMEIKE